MTLSRFLNHLASAVPGWPDACPEWDDFRRAVVLRSRGHNLGAGLNEACDLALLAHRLATTDDLDVALTAAHHAFKAADSLRTLAAKGRGSSGPVHVDETT